MWSYFTHKERHALYFTKHATLDLPKTHSFYCGTNAAHFQGSLI